MRAFAFVANALIAILNHMTTKRIVFYTAVKICWATIRILMVALLGEALASTFPLKLRNLKEACTPMRNYTWNAYINTRR